MTLGTLITLDTLKATSQSIVEIGEDKTFAAIDAARMVHNKFVADMIGTLCVISTDRRRRYGGPATMTMRKVNQMGITRAQKVTAGTDVDFPLEMAEIAVQWNRKFMENATGKEMAEQFVAAQDADVKRVLADIKIGLFDFANYSVLDELVDNTTLNVKRLVNADSAAMPLGPNGEEFDGSTHTHYNAATAAWSGATAAQKSADLEAHIEDVVEHYAGGGEIKLYINRAQENQVRSITGLTGSATNFEKYTDARIIRGTNTDYAAGTLSRDNLYNRAIGVFGPAEVWVKPWIPSGYILCFREGTEKPLVFRERRPGSGGLVINAEFDSFPLRARQLEREFGIGVWNRIAAAVLYVNGTSYVVPTITA
jgi:hypothetical protein